MHERLDSQGFFVADPGKRPLAAGHRMKGIEDSRRRQAKLSRPHHLPTSLQKDAPLPLKTGQ